MEARANKLLSCAIALTLALPGTALAESVVPPENSAVNQYTEAIPTGGGQKDAGKAADHGKQRSPASVLGSHKAKKLEAQGPAGHDVAEVVAATAPSTEPAPPPPEPQPEPAANGDQGGGIEPHQGIGPARAVSQTDGDAQSEPALRQVDIPSGSSGLGEVLAQATGSSSTGQLGALLPLLVIATIAWALAFLWRQRQRPA